MAQPWRAGAAAVLLGALATTLTACGTPAAASGGMDHVQFSGSYVPLNGGVPEDYGTVVAQEGDVSAYTPVREGNQLKVPVSVTNHGAERASYRVTVRVTGPDGFEAEGGFSTDTTGISPSATWPSEVLLSASGQDLPDNPEVEIVQVKRK
jgi:hypothetical protein